MEETSQHLEIGATEHAHISRRTAWDGIEYTESEFAEWYGEAYQRLIAWPGNYAWDGRLQRRAWDGNWYTEEEFAEWYGSQYLPGWNHAYWNTGDGLDENASGEHANEKEQAPKQEKRHSCENAEVKHRDKGSVASATR